MPRDLGAITVKFKDGKHVCKPTTIEVEPGDTLTWVGEESFFVLFTGESPFEEGQGTFVQNQKVTVKSGLPSRKEFTPQFKVQNRFLMKTEGSVIIR